MAIAHIPDERRTLADEAEIRNHLAGPGDLLSVPRGMRHRFGLCPERRIRAIRLFQDPSGWAAHYTERGAERDYQPVCLGHSYAPPAGAV